MSTINGASGMNGILNMWQNHYKGLFNSTRDNKVKDEDEALHTLKVENYSFEIFTFEETCNIFKCLKIGTSPCIDNIYREHFKFADESVQVYLTLLFNAVVIHGYIPLELMDTVIVYIHLIKDKTCDITSKDNYRRIAIACNVSKSLELLMLSRIRYFVSRNCNQFGFKEKLGTDISVYITTSYRILYQPI